MLCLGPAVARRDWSAQVCPHHLHGGRTHQDRTELGLRTAEEDDKKADIEAACKASSVCNLMQSVGTQDEQVIVPCYHWTTFFRDTYKPIVGLLLFHSFAVSAEATSAVVFKARSLHTVLQRGSSMGTV